MVYFVQVVLEELMKMGKETNGRMDDGGNAMTKAKMASGLVSLKHYKGLLQDASYQIPVHLA